MCESVLLGRCGSAAGLASADGLAAAGLASGLAAGLAAVSVTASPDLGSFLSLLGII